MSFSLDAIVSNLGYVLVGAAITAALAGAASPVHADSWTGSVSFYSRAGCVGCSKSLLMANGQPLADYGQTIAFNWLPLNTKVKITNLDNNRSLIVTVTDRHGAYKAKYNWRIADLTIGVARWLDVKTDKSTIKIETL